MGVDPSPFRPANGSRSSDHFDMIAIVVPLPVSLQTTLGPRTVHRAECELRGFVGGAKGAGPDRSSAESRMRIQVKTRPRRERPKVLFVDARA
jgi:hypothetical protein